MRFLSLLAAALLPVSSLAAKSTYETFSKKAASTPALKLDDTSFAKLTGAPRNHTVAVLFTALETQVGCQMCTEFQPEWELLAKSWLNGDKTNEGQLLFGTLDFADGRGAFQAAKLTTAPVLFLYHPTEGPRAKGDGSPVRYDFSNGPQRAESIHAWLSRQLPDIPHPPVARPFNWVRLIVTVTAALGGISAISVGWPYILPVIGNRNLWAAVSLLAVLLFTSGHMFNQIRSTPYVAGNGKGGIMYFAGGFQNQLGLESQIVAALYGALSFATINLALKVPRIANPRSQQVAVFIWGAVILGVYSLLLSVFRIKNQGYPFWLPPF